MRIVIKIGTSTLTDKSGKLNIPYIDSFAQEIAKLKNSGIKCDKIFVKKYIKRR